SGPVTAGGGRWGFISTWWGLTWRVPAQPGAPPAAHMMAARPEAIAMGGKRRMLMLAFIKLGFSR
ncbi:MAG: hypothetical protein ACT4N8_12345, partial [Sphingosinicella sp.]|uniref:hypothetical protein n=1 Tax=Sphingosinicella sp. TaxID=1917971 RepID=UPI00403801B7